jgi:hypothetical protein
MKSRRKKIREIANVWSLVKTREKCELCGGTWVEHVVSAGGKHPACENFVNGKCPRYASKGAIYDQY